jgi:uncharacterized membrane protein YkvA (DUF1232 family)
MQLDDCLPFRLEFYNSKLSRFLQARTNISNDSKSIKYIEDFYIILCSLEIEETIDRNTRENINTTLNYFASPIDVLPEAIFGTYGYYDDICLSAHLLREMFGRYEVQIISRKRKYGLFKGEAQPFPQLMKTIIQECREAMHSDDFENLKYKFPHIVK